MPRNLGLIEFDLGSGQVGVRHGRATLGHPSDATTSWRPQAVLVGRRVGWIDSGLIIRVRHPEDVQPWSVMMIALGPRCFLRVGGSGSGSIIGAEGGSRRVRVASSDHAIPESPTLHTANCASVIGGDMTAVVVGSIEDRHGTVEPPLSAMQT